MPEVLGSAAPPEAQLAYIPFSSPTSPVRSLPPVCTPRRPGREGCLTLVPPCLMCSCLLADARTCTVADAPPSTNTTWVRTHPPQADGTHHFRTTFLPAEQDIAGLVAKLTAFHATFMSKYGGGGGSDAAAAAANGNHH